MYPEVRRDVAAQVPRPPPAALRRVRHAQVRDLLPVRPGLPDRVHRHGRHRHARPLPRPLGRARDLRRAARGIRAPPIRPAGARPGLPAVRAGRPRRASTRSSRTTTTTRRDMLDDPRGDAGGVRLPAGRRAQADQPADGRLVRDDLRHRDLLRPPALRAGRRRPTRPPPSTAHRPSEAAYLAALDAALGGAAQRAAGTRGAGAN